MVGTILTKVAPVAVQLGYEGVKNTLKAAIPIGLGFVAGTVALNAGEAGANALGSMLKSAKAKAAAKKATQPQQ